MTPFFSIFLDEYNLLDWTKHAVNFKEEGYLMRCEYCYISRLDKVFKYAKGYFLPTNYF